MSEDPVGVGRCPGLQDFADRVVHLVAQHPAVREIRLVGSRATGEARPESDWDFRVATTDFASVARALPRLAAPLNPLATQWDRLSDQQCWMLILPGPVKVDLIFPEEPHTHKPPWQPRRDNVEAVDAHFWDWVLWLRAKEAGAECEIIAAELRKLSDHLLRPLGVEPVPATIAEAVALYRAARDDAERNFGCTIPRQLESEVVPAIL
jgi:hypothetical protein